MTHITSMLGDVKGHRPSCNSLSGACLPISRLQEVAEMPKLVFHTSSKVKRSLMSPPLNAATENQPYPRNGKAYANFILAKLASQNWYCGSIG